MSYGEHVEWLKKRMQAAHEIVRSQLNLNKIA